MKTQSAQATAYGQFVARELAEIIARRIADLVVAAFRQRGSKPAVPAHGGPWLDSVCIDGRKRLVLSEWSARSGLHLVVDPLAGVREQGMDRVVHIGHRRP